MHISIAYIKPELAESARKQATAMAKAVDAGAMGAVDTAAAELRALATDEVLIGYERWQEVLRAIRNVQEDFTASYLLNTAAQELVLSSIPSPGQGMEEEKALLCIVAQAHRMGGLVLELPLLEDEDEQQRHVYPLSG
jgi:hypothetical protein